MTDLTRLDIAIAEASEFLKLARKLHALSFENAVLIRLGAAPPYPIDEAAKVRASSLRVSRALVDLRRKEGKRL